MSAMQLLRGVLVTGGRQIDDGLVAVEGDRVAWAGAAAEWTGAAPPDPRPDRYLLPGLVDVHCHGAAGHGFPDADTPGLRAAIGHHLRHGTTTLLGSLVSAPADVLQKRVAHLAPLVASGDLAGIHLEGPFLAVTRCGAHDPKAIVAGNPDMLRGLIDAASGRISSMTLAPETPHYRELARVMAQHGILPSLGHTDATAAVANAAIAAAAGGRLSATHLFNGMPPVHHRAPGAATACLAAAARGEMVVELVADGVHLADETVAAVFDLVGPGQIALTTDAMAAAGMPDGTYPLGAMRVEVVQGTARLAGPQPQVPGPLAGGTSRLIDIVRRVVGRCGVQLADAVTAASATPASLLGLGGEVGDLAAGRRADVLITAPTLVPVAVMRGGQWVPHEREAV